MREAYSSLESVGATRVRSPAAVAAASIASSVVGTGFSRWVAWREARGAMGTSSGPSAP